MIKKQVFIIFSLSIAFLSSCSNKAFHTYTYITNTEEMNKDIIGRQGLAIDKDYYYVSGSKTLAKYDKEWNLVLLNDNPFSKGYIKEVNHIGDIDCFNGEIYCGVEYFLDGVGKDIQIAVYDANTLEFKRSFPFNQNSGQLECSGIAINPDEKKVVMVSWVGEDSGKYIYEYNLSDGAYSRKILMQEPPKWIQGIAYYDGNYYMTADDGMANGTKNGEKDHMYSVKITNSDTCDVKVEKTFEDFIIPGEIEGLSFDKDNKMLYVHSNHGMEIIQGMTKDPYPGYDKEHSVIYQYQIQ